MDVNDCNFFKQARDAKGLTQFQAAVAIGVTTSAISSWENGSVPRLSLASKIAQVYGLHVPELLKVMHEMAEAEKASKA